MLANVGDELPARLRQSQNVKIEYIPGLNYGSSSESLDLLSYGSREVVVGHPKGGLRANVGFSETAPYSLGQHDVVLEPWAEGNFNLGRVPDISSSDYVELVAEDGIRVFVDPLTRIEAAKTQRSERAQESSIFEDPPDGRSNRSRELWFTIEIQVFRVPNAREEQTKVHATLQYHGIAVADSRELFQQEDVNGLAGLYRSMYNLFHSYCTI